MIRKYLIYGLTGVLLAGLVIGFLWFRKSTRLTGDPLNAIPYDAAIIVKINNYTDLVKEISKENNVFTQLGSLPAFNEFRRHAGLIDSMLLKYPEARKIFTSAPAYISLQYSGRATIGSIHYFSLPGNIKAHQVNTFIKRVIGNSGTITPRKYEGETVYDLVLLNNNIEKNLSYTIVNDILMLSHSSILLEDALRQLNQTKSVKSDNGFIKILSTAGKNVDANIFINFKYFPQLLSLFTKSPYKELIGEMNYLADWSGLDVNFKEDNIILNGFTSSVDSGNMLSDLFINQNAPRSSIGEVLPSTISTFISMGMEDFNTYYTQYKALLKNNGNYARHQNDLDQLKKSYGENLEKLFGDIIDNEFCLALGENNNNSGEQEAFAVFKVKSKSFAEKRLSEMLENYTGKNNINSYITKYQLDNESSYKIYKLPTQHMIANLFGNIFKVVNEHYYTFVGNYLIFGNSVKSLSLFIHQNVINQTLINDPTYKIFADNLSAKSNVVFYTNLSRSIENFSNLVDEKLVKSWEKNIGVFQKVQTLGLQINSGNNMLYNTITLKYSPKFYNKTHTVWESLLDTVSDFKPKFVVNHITKQYEIFIQDLKNNIYLINKAGRIEWKVQIPEKIRSDVYQIDYYKNGKLQYLFSTDNYLYLMDRNGNYVEKYPVKLRAKATNGMALFDYDDNKDYRIFIACDDNKIYNYMKDGSIVSGWEFGKTESAVNMPIEHFTIGDKDYIVFGDRLKTYILDRRGDTRVDVKELFPRSVNNSYLLDEGGDAPRLVTTDTSGTVKFIYFDGSVKDVKIGEFSPTHYFDFKDMDGDGKREFIFLDGKSLQVFKQNKTKMFSYAFDGRISERPIYFHFSYNDRKLGAVCSSKNEIYLINNDGSLFPGFPLRGSTSFSIGDFNRETSQFNLIVGNKDNFLYNYAVK